MEQSILLRRQSECGNVSEIHDTFKQYCLKVRDMRELSSRLHDINLMNMTKALEDGIYHLSNMYENELQTIRDQIEECAREKNQHQLSASQGATKVEELEKKVANETADRKKVEDDYADAQREIALKDKQLEDARVTLTQEQNSHLETKKEKDGTQKQLNQTQDHYNAEAADRTHFETLSVQLKEKMEFDKQRFEQEKCDYSNRISDLGTALKMAEERIHEHNVIDEDMANQLAKVKLQSEADFSLFKQESELDFQNRLVQCKSELESETKKLAETNDEIIRLKANAEGLSVRASNAEAKAASTECQNADLIKELEYVRQCNKDRIQELEEKARGLQEDLNARIRELDAAYAAEDPIHVEMDAFGAFMEAEDRRLKIATANPNHVITRSEFLTRADLPLKTSVGVRPYKRMSTPKMSRPSSVEPLPPVIDPPGRLNREKTNNSLHRSLPDPLPKGANTSWDRQVPRFKFVDRGYPANPAPRPHSLYYQSPLHKRYPTN